MARQSPHLYTENMPCSDAHTTPAAPPSPINGWHAAARRGASQDGGRSSAVAAK
jgi:hypothetical protein